MCGVWTTRVRSRFKTLDPCSSVFFFFSLSMCVCVYVWAHSLLCCVVVVEWVRVCECVLLEQTCDRVRANDGAVLCCGGGLS